MTKISGSKKTRKTGSFGHRGIIPNSTYCWVSVSAAKRPGSNSSQPAKTVGRRKNPEMTEYEYRNLGNDRRIFPELMEHKRLNNQGNGGHERQNFAKMMQLKRRKNHRNGGNARRILPEMQRDGKITEDERRNFEEVVEHKRRKTPENERRIFRK